MPIKISADSREALRPVYEGVKSFLEKEREREERMGGHSYGGRETFY